MLEQVLFKSVLRLKIAEHVWLFWSLLNTEDLHHVGRALQLCTLTSRGQSRRGNGWNPGVKNPFYHELTKVARALWLLLHFRHESEVQHLKVMKDSKRQYFLWSEKFSSLNKLVEFYKTTSVFKTREIYLNDGSSDSKSPSVIQTVSNSTLPLKDSVNFSHQIWDYWS